METMTTVQEMPMIWQMTARMKMTIVVTSLFEISDRWFFELDLPINFILYDISVI